MTNSGHTLKDDRVHRPDWLKVADPRPPRPRRPRGAKATPKSLSEVLDEESELSGLLTGGE